MQLWNLISENRHISFRVTEQPDGIPTWNAEMEILYVLEGQAQVESMGQVWVLHPEDFIVFQPYEIHTIRSTSCRTISLFIFPALLQLQNRYQDTAAQIACCSAKPTAPDVCYQEIRRQMANLLSSFSQNAKEYPLYADALVLLSILQENFLTPKKKERRKDQNAIEHLQRIVRYMDEHYMDNLTLDEVARTEFISANYVSHLFRNYLNTPFLQYLRMLRLNHAYADLVNTQDSITDIALKNGFSSATLFIRYFDAMYGKTPAKFRKERESQEYYQPLLLSDQEDILAPLMRHANAFEQEGAYLHKNMETREVFADCSRQGWQRPSSWNALMNVGWAKEALLAPIQQQILRASKDLGFRMIRFHGIFDRDMYIYNQDEDGTVFYNFDYLEMLFDFLISSQLVPFIEFGFIPPQLASDPHPYYNHDSCICLPHDLERWGHLVEATLRHCINRYGLRQVLQWRFSLFNSVYVYYGCISEEEWWILWRATYQAVKRVHPSLAFGLNDDLGLIVPPQRGESTRFWDYIENCRSQSCLPDFISLQCFYGDYYATGKTAFGKVYTQKEMPLPHSPDENYLSHKLDYLTDMLHQYHMDHLPILFEAWNSTVWQRDSCNDGCFKSAFLVKNILENEERLQAFGHWTLSDFMEEVPHSPDVFHGGYGILTYNGIPKPGYYALQLIRLLGDCCLAQGNGYFITREGDQIHILLYHYYHYDLLYQRHYTRRSDSVFKFENSISFSVTLHGLLPGKYNLTTRSISRDNGSSYDAWLSMGAPDHLTLDQVEYIKEVSKPKIEIRLETLEAEYHFACQLRAHEVQLLTLNRIHE